MLNVNLGGVMPLGYFFINLRGTMPLRGAKLLQNSDNTKKNPSNLLPIAGIFINY